jgi:hypothetical protein
LVLVLWAMTRPPCGPATRSQLVAPRVMLSGVPSIVVSPGLSALEYFMPDAAGL